MVPCNLSTCDQSKPKGEMSKATTTIDGQPIVGYACTTGHAYQLARQWQTGDRYSEPVDPLWATVGNGQVAA